MTSDYHAEAVRRFVATEPPLFNAGPECRSDSGSLMA